MAKKGSKKKHKMPDRFSKEKTVAEAAPNPFELLHSRKKFNILGQKKKGVAKKTTRSRNEAAQKRANTLLVEYKQLRKANTFLDRRFGEDDESLTAEEKALLRLQQQRMKEADKFALPDDDGGGSDGDRGEGLTHMGRPLADVQDAFGRPDDDEREDERLNADLTAELHFGGGFIRKDTPTAVPGDDVQGAEPGRRRSKKEIMEEVMAKSKAHRADRHLQREEDEAATQALDDTFRMLIADPALGALVRPKGVKQEPKTAVQQSAEEAAFDRARRELVFELRSAPADRTRTAEELAELERQRLEDLERRRLKRMRGADDSDASDDDGDEAPAGGFAKRRFLAARAEADPDGRAGRDRSKAGVGGDDLDENFKLSDDEEGGGASDGSQDEEGSEEGGSGDDADGPLQQRQKQRAAGDHELQARFRLATAELLKRHGVQPTKQSAAELEAAQGGELADGGSGGSEFASDGESGEDEPGVEVMAKRGAETEASKQPAKQAADVAEEDSAAGGDSDGSGQDAELYSDAGAGEEDERAALQPYDARSGAASGRPPALDAAERSKGEPSTSGRKARQLEGPLDISFTPPVPDSYEAFAALVAGRPPSDVLLLVARIRAANAAALNSENRRKMQAHRIPLLPPHIAFSTRLIPEILYGILVQHFATLAGRFPPELDHLDALTHVLAPATVEVPFYAATVARARLGRFRQRLADALAAPSDENDHGWPAPRVALQLQLFAALWPLSDRRHPVATPLALLLAAYLALCTPAGPRHVVTGLLLACLATRAAAAASRLMPEPLTFAVRIVAASAAADGDDPYGCLTSADDDNTSNALPDSLPPLRLSTLLGSPADADAACGTATVRQAALLAAVRLIGRLASVLRDTTAFPELFSPARRALEALAARQGIHKDVEAARAIVLEAVQQRRAEIEATRQPLVRRPCAAAALRMYNPRFEEDYAAGKDYDPDRERAATKKLKRQLQKEKRGAMRELRKDSAFIGSERDAEKLAARAERRAAGRAGWALLQAQEHDMKSGGQKGMWKKGGGKKPFSRRN